MDLDDHIRQLIIKIENSNEVSFINAYMKAQLLVGCGDFEKALPLLDRAFAEARSISDSYLYQQTYLNIGTLLCQVLDCLNQLDQCEIVFEELLRTSPNALFVGDYAVFLHRRKRDFPKAEAFYVKSLEEYPFQSSIRLKYAGFLRHIRKDMVGAERQYKLAVDCNPNSSEAVGSYASFLHGVKGQLDEAEEFYQKAVALDALHANNLCNYGLFLSEVRGNYLQAEKLYSQVLLHNPAHSNTLYNCAVMLDSHCKRKNEAEALYRRCIAIEPKHSYALYNLAVLLEDNVSPRWKARCNSNSQADVIEIDEMFREIYTMYKNAHIADPYDSTTAADLGRFVFAKLEDPSKAEPILQLALKLDPSNEVALFNIALLSQNKGNDEAAESMLRKLLSVNSRHSSAAHILGRLLAEKLRKGNESNTGQLESAKDVLDDICSLYESALDISKNDYTIISEYLKIITSIGTAQHKRRLAQFGESCVDVNSFGNNKGEILKLFERLKAKLN